MEQLPEEITNQNPSDFFHAGGAEKAQNKQEEGVVEI